MAANKIIKIDDRKLVMSQDSPFLVKEDYRALRTNIVFSFPDDKSKVIAFTSSARHEGKSINSINLAISFAELDKKVLLIDCDLRLPTIASKLDIEKTGSAKGLSDLLIGEVNLRDTMTYLRDKKIYVMCAGTIPPDPTRLLQSERMGEVLENLKKVFDYIILDCPPITEVIDAALLAPHVDGFLLLVRHSESDHKNIRVMMEQMRLANAKILGFVYANSPLEDKKYYKKGGYYKYYKKEPEKKKKRFGAGK